MTELSQVDDKAPVENDGAVPSIRMVVQRYRKANVLIDESKVITVGNYRGLLADGDDDDDNKDDDDNNDDKKPSCSVGLLAYISFAKTANAQLVEQAAKTLLHLPVLTQGGWGDGSTTRSILQLATASSSDNNDNKNNSSSSLSVVLIPQANLISKVKRSGRSIQYHDQIEKSRGEELYNLFVRTVRDILLEHQSVARGESAKHKNPNKPTTPDPSIPPTELFRQDDTYASFDERGFPLTVTEGGQPLTKSARKKLQKVHDSHVKRHEKYLKNPDSKPAVVAEKPKVEAKLDDTFVHLVSGSFGKRQGLELFSDMGPFCHIVDI